MRPSAFLMLVMACAGCAPPTSALPSTLVSPSAIDPARASELARSGDRVLFAEPEPRGPEGTDVRLARPMAVQDGDRWVEPPAPSLTGALLANAVVWVTVDGRLLIDDGARVRTLDHGVIPELAVSPDGERLAYAKAPGDDPGVYVWDGRTRARVTEGLAIADRPLFLDDARLLVVGARPSGIAGVWIASLDGGAPEPVTNAALRTGQPFGDAFVPPPADHASMRIEGSTLVYFDGRGERTVELP